MVSVILVIMLIIVVVIVQIMFASGIKMIRPYEQGVVEYPGNYRRTLGPGFHRAIPLIIRIHHVYTRKSTPGLTSREYARALMKKWVKK